MNNNYRYNSILQNFQNGKYSYNDYLKIKTWFNRIEDHKEVEESLFKQWNELVNNEQGKEDSLQHIFEKVQYNILLEDNKRQAKKVIWNFYRQAAAIFLIPVLVFSLWYYFSNHSPESAIYSQSSTQGWIEINAPQGARVEFFLPDSTTGWLNSRSKLKYPLVFNQHRKVELTGEAYFEVKHKNKSDFTVSIPDMDINVIGTKFNVTAYPSEPHSDVVLKEGKVKIYGKRGILNYTLSPDEKATFNSDSRKLIVAQVEADRYTEWKDGYLIIENEPLGNVIGRIERWYNIDMVIQDEKLKNYRFKATFKDEPIEEVMRLIAKTTPIDYIVQKREVNSKGVFKKKKVIMKLK